MNTANETNALRLRPMGVADMLDAAVQLYRRAFVKLVTTTALIVLPLSALQTVVQMAWILPMMSPSSSPADDTSSLVLVAQMLNLALALAYALATYGVLTPALVWLAGRRYLGQPASVGAAVRATLRRLPVIIAIALLYLLVMLSLFIVGLVPCGGWLVAPPLALFISINTLALLAPVVMLENHGVRVSIKRCWLLTKYNFGRALGLMLALYLFNTFATAGPSALATVAVLALSENLALGTAISAGLGALVAIVYFPLWGIGLTLLYYDARVRCEAFDLEVLAGLDSDPAANVRHLIWFERSDWKKLLVMAGLSLAPFVAVGACYALLLVFVLAAGGAN